jgi:hypothetical protein
MLEREREREGEGEREREGEKEFIDMLEREFYRCLISSG